jgi:hydrogenase maturation protein HypF
MNARYEGGHPLAKEARRVLVAGRVQGVGFRPFVWRLATRLGLSGDVHNDAGRVEIAVAGPAETLDAFQAALLAEAPPLARPHIAAVEPLAAVPRDGFRIEPSTSDGPRDVFLPPDQSLCPQCLRELFDPADRRWRHPFINCTQCGPRYTVIRDLPYDRASTSMAGFALCETCRREYDDPADRRFHAEPLACPACGPRLRFEGGAGTAWDGDALRAAVAALRSAAVVAVKGVGGYHLMCDAHDAQAIARLRLRKQRPAKPLAVMFPLAGACGVSALWHEVDPDEPECDALLDPARPIVLMRRRQDSTLPDSIAPGLEEIGVFLPYSPLHALLLADFGGPLVATSGNLSGEPVLTDENEATRRLAHVADAFLHHDRPIVRPADDPVVRVIAGRVRPVRLGRGNAPLEIESGFDLREPVLAVGGQMKNTIALGFGERIVVSPHIGDLDSPRGRDVFVRTAQDLQRMFGVTAAHVVADRHPAYASTAWALASGLPVTTVLHHHAHASALAWERPDVGEWLVFAWDGVGLGDDGTMWGGEALLGAPGRWTRAGSWRTFRPPGGDRAAREPWRSAAAMCWETGVALPGVVPGSDVAQAGWRAGVNAVATSAVGRLFDAAACLILPLHAASYEAQGPMLLEALAGTTRGEPVAAPMSTDAGGVLRIDWAPLLRHVAEPSRSRAKRAADFHATLAEAALRQALALRERAGFDAIGLAGGVFQNRVLSEMLVERCEAHGLAVHVAARVPVNDAGLAFGQVVEHAAALRRPARRRERRSDEGSRRGDPARLAPTGAA